MKSDSERLVSILKSELTFLENAGYRREPPSLWYARLIFEDSPTCVNYGRAKERRSCRECTLMQFVPAKHASRSVPCRHIPLNQEGETLDSLYRSATQEEVEISVAEWLRSTIRDLEPAKVGHSLEISRRRWKRQAHPKLWGSQSEGGQG